MCQEGLGLSSLCPCRVSHPSPHNRSPMCHHSTAEHHGPSPLLGEIRAPSSPTSNHTNASDTVPLHHCHHTQGGCVCTSDLSRHPLEHGNVYCRVNPTSAQGEWESCPALRQKLAGSTQMKLGYSELLEFATESQYLVSVFDMYGSKKCIWSPWLSWIFLTALPFLLHPADV